MYVVRGKFCAVCFIGNFGAILNLRCACIPDFPSIEAGWMLLLVASLNWNGLLISLGKISVFFIGTIEVEF